MSVNRNRLQTYSSHANATATCISFRRRTFSFLTTIVFVCRRHCRPCVMKTRKTFRHRVRIFYNEKENAPKHFAVEYIFRILETKKSRFFHPRSNGDENFVEFIRAKSFGWFLTAVFRESHNNWVEKTIELWDRNIMRNIYFF